MKKLFLLLLLFSSVPLVAGNDSFSWVYGLIARKVTSLKKVVSHLLFTQPVDPRIKPLQQEWCMLFKPNGKLRTAHEVREAIDLFLKQHRDLFGNRLVEDLINAQEDGFKLRRTLFHNLVECNIVEQQDELYTYLVKLGARTDIGDCSHLMVNSMFYDKNQNRPRPPIVQPKILSDQSEPVEHEVPSVHPVQEPETLLPSSQDTVVPIDQLCPTIPDPKKPSWHCHLSNGLLVGGVIALVCLYRYLPHKVKARVLI